MNSPRRKKAAAPKSKAPDSSNQQLIVGLAVGFGVIGISAAVLMFFQGGGQSAPTPPPQSSEIQAIAETPPDPALATAAPAPVPAPAAVLPSAPAASADPATSPMSLASATPLASGNDPALMTLPPAAGAAAMPAPAGAPGPAMTPTAVPGAPAPTPPALPAVELPLTDLVDLVEQSVVRISVKQEYGGAIGSGFVIDESGAIITNYHVVEGATEAEVEFRDGSKLPVDGFFHADPELDLALIHVTPGNKPLQPLPITANPPRKGEKVATFGAPRGLSFSTSEGIISGLRSPEEVGKKQGSYIQTTAPISPGNSGGPLTNLFGELVGVNTFQRTDGESLNFAISAADVKSLVDRPRNAPQALSPTSIPVKVAGQFASAEDFVGTERGKLLLGQIREACVLCLPVSFDPSGRVTDFVTAMAERTFEQKLKWTLISPQGKPKPSTALVVLVLIFVPTANEAQGVSNDLTLFTQIIVRDVDKDGHELLAKIWEDKKAVGKVSLQALAQGIISKSMQTNVREYFDRLVAACRTAARKAGS